MGIKCKGRESKITRVLCGATGQSFGTWDAHWLTEERLGDECIRDDGDCLDGYLINSLQIVGCVFQTPIT